MELLFQLPVGFPRKELAEKGSVAEGFFEF